MAAATNTSTSWFNRTWSAFTGSRRVNDSPFAELGTSGTTIIGGYIVERERNPKLLGAQKHETAAEILTNVSVVAAGVRYFLNLVAKAKYRPEAPDDSPEAKMYAEFIAKAMDSMVTPWSRVVRRAALHRFHGFSIQEWTATKDADGRTIIKDVESRPQFTIAQWDVDPGGTVIGVIQRSPVTNTDIYLPRSKLIYCVDDAFTDSPEGMGWLRALAGPANTLKQLLKLEGIGFERDLSGIPIGRAPLSAINKAIADGSITAEEGHAMVGVIERFVKMEVRKENTGVVLDSATYDAVSADGTKPSNVPKWSIETLTGSSQSLTALGAAINRVNHEMARIIGTENLLVGSEGAGSLALSQDKTENMLLAVNAASEDIAATFTNDFVGPLGRLNGLPADKMPRLKVEKIQFADVAKMATVLRDLAVAGSPLTPDDSAIDDLRDAMGISRAPEFEIGDLSLSRGSSRMSSFGGMDGQSAVDAIQGGITKATPPRSLYVRRQLLNADEFIQWAKDQGFRTALLPKEMHVTLCYSKAPMIWPEPLPGEVAVTSQSTTDSREVAVFGAATVLRFESRALTKRAEQLRDMGASSDFPDFSAHVTITYDPGNITPDLVMPYAGRLVFGPEIFQEIDDSWESSAVEKGMQSK